MASDYLLKSQEHLAPQLMESTRSQVESMRGIGQSFLNFGQSVQGDLRRGQDRDFQREMMDAEQAFRQGQFDTEMEFQKREADRQYGLAQERQELSQASAAAQLFLQQKELAAREMQIAGNMMTKAQSLEIMRQKHEQFMLLNNAETAQTQLSSQKLAIAQQKMALIQFGEQLGLSREDISGIVGFEVPETEDPMVVGGGLPGYGAGTKDPFGGGPTVMKDSKGFYVLNTRTKERMRLTPENAARYLASQERNERQRVYEQLMGMATKEMGLLSKRAATYGGDPALLDEKARGELEAIQGQMKDITDLVDAWKSGQSPQQGPPAPGQGPHWIQRLKQKKHEEFQSQVRNVHGYVSKNTGHARRIIGDIWGKDESFDDFVDRLVDTRMWADLQAAEQQGDEAVAALAQRSRESYKTQFIVELANKMGAEPSKPFEDAKWFVEGDAKVPLPKGWSKRKTDLFYRWVEAFKAGRVKSNPKAKRLMRDPTDVKKGMYYPEEMALNAQTSPEGDVNFEPEFFRIISQASKQLRSGLGRNKKKVDRFKILEQQLK